MSSRPLFGKAALARLYRRGVRRDELRPLLFLDFDDVICVSKPYGGYDLFVPAVERPADLLERLWHPPAVATLLTIVEEYRPAVILTTSWLRLMERPGFESLFRQTGLGVVADSLHVASEAPQVAGETRLQAIERWLHARYQGERLVVLDDAYSGSGLKGSRLDKAGAVVLCQVGVGLSEVHLAAVRRALAPTPHALEVPKGIAT